MSRRKAKTVRNKLDAVNISIAKAKLAKLEEGLAPKESEYTRIADLKPLDPEERDALVQRFVDRFEAMDRVAAQKKYDWYMANAHWAP